jgi:hypothetical protein
MEVIVTGHSFRLARALGAFPKEEFPAVEEEHCEDPQINFASTKCITGFVQKSSFAAIAKRKMEIVSHDLEI